jgi:hypothetical protein
VVVQSKVGLTQISNLISMLLRAQRTTVYALQPTVYACGMGMMLW